MVVLCTTVEIRRERAQRERAQLNCRDQITLNDDDEPRFLDTVHVHVATVDST